MTKGKKCLAVFDFDGTITKRDSFNDFLVFCFGYCKLILFFVVNFPKLIKYKLNAISNLEIKQVMLSHFLKGMPYNEYLDLCGRYAKKRLPRIINEKCLDKIRWHKSKGHTLVILTASFEKWIAPWALKYGFVKVIASVLEVKDGVLTGLVKKESDCFGRNKPMRLKEEIQDIDSYYIYAYGDSPSDKYMLDMADERFFRRYV